MEYHLDHSLFPLVNRDFHKYSDDAMYAARSITHAFVSQSVRVLDGRKPNKLISIGQFDRWIRETGNTTTEYGRPIKRFYAYLTYKGPMYTIGYQFSESVAFFHHSLNMREREFCFNYVRVLWLRKPRKIGRKEYVRHLFSGIGVGIE